jgi:hypothetical protein
MYCGRYVPSMRWNYCPCLQGRYLRTYHTTRRHSQVHLPPSELQSDEVWTCVLSCSDSNITWRLHSFARSKTLFLAGDEILTVMLMNFAGTWRHVFGQLVPDVSNDIPFPWRLESLLYYLPWRWRQHVPPKRQWQHAKLQTIITQRAMKFYSPSLKRQSQCCFFQRLAVV